MNIRRFVFRAGLISLGVSVLLSSPGYSKISVGDDSIFTASSHKQRTVLVGGSGFDDVVRFEDKLIFESGEDRIGGLSSKRELYYNVSGYIGGDEGFKQEFFDNFNFFTLSRPQNLFFLSGSIRRSDVISFFTDGAPLRVGGPDENLKKELLQRLGIEQADNITWGQKDLFNGGCYLTNIYFDGKLGKTIAWVNISKSALFPSSVGKGTILPGACLVAGIAYHLGLHNVGVLDPAQMVVAEEGGAGILRVSDAVRIAMKILYQKNVAYEGLSRKDFLSNVEKYASDNKINLNVSGVDK